MTGARLKAIFWPVVLIILLAAVFVAYLRPSLMVALTNQFFALCGW